MFRSFIEWTEKDKSRGRKVVLFLTVFVFLLITIGVFVAAIYGVKMATAITSLYVTLVGLMVSIYGFYTGTSSDKSEEVADKAADILMKKMGEIE